MEQVNLFGAEPVMEFQDIEHAYALLKEWQSRLFLDDWIIKLNLRTEPMYSPDGSTRLQGRNEFCVDLKSAVITIDIPDDDARNRIVKFCAECVLVHELLHCKYNWLSLDATSVEKVYFDTLEHSLIEQMAKSLIMAKYNIPFYWFKNF